MNVFIFGSVRYGLVMKIDSQHPTIAKCITRLRGAVHDAHLDSNQAEPKKVKPADTPDSVHGGCPPRD
ncbi:MAG: hypothetical protein Q4A11_06905, partial [Brachymonas sp.]|nr:hypothetical protein [Brachymonas sp.]